MKSKNCLYLCVMIVSVAMIFLGGCTDDEVQALNAVGGLMQIHPDATPQESLLGNLIQEEARREQNRRNYQRRTDAWK